AVIAFAAVAEERPGDRPFGAALIVRKILAAGEGLVGDGGAVADLLGETVGEAAGEVKDRLFGDLLRGEGGVAVPADLDAGEQISLGAGELVEALRAEGGVDAEDFGVGGEGDGGAAA